MYIYRLNLVLLIILGVCVAASAKTPEEQGMEIAVEADKRDIGWHDNQSASKMLLRNSHGEESIREFRRFAFEVNEPGMGDKSIVVFDSPKDIKDTALLSHTKILKPDNQWLYLPALKRVKRISSSNKSGPFVGSEFAYEDLLSQEVDKYSYKFLGEEACSNLGCYKVERVPLYKNSGYTKQIIWWDKEEYRIQKIEFYDRKNSLLKTLVYSDYNLYLDNYWRARLLSMQNHQTGKSTDLVFENWEFNLGQEENFYTPNKLKRER